jgi:hypothetical protein
LNSRPLEFLRTWIHAIDATIAGQPFDATEDIGAELVKARSAAEKAERQYADLRDRVNRAGIVHSSDRPDDVRAKTIIRKLL